MDTDKYNRINGKLEAIRNDVGCITIMVFFILVLTILRGCSPDVQKKTETPISESRE